MSQVGPDTVDNGDGTTTLNTVEWVKLLDKYVWLDEQLMAIGRIKLTRTKSEFDVEMGNLLGLPKGSKGAADRRRAQ